MEEVIIQHLGKMNYLESWDLQKSLVQEVIALKKKRAEDADLKQKHYFLFCEHPHVFTLGRSGEKENLLLDEKGLKDHDAVFHKINRGGDITYHGPGQVVGYPILDLDCFFTDIHKFVRYIEEAAIRTIAEYGVVGERIDGLSGVWVRGDENSKDRKICAIGIHLSRWVTMHGFALNANTDLSYFGHIVPCGITDKEVTSIQNETGKMVEIEGVIQKLNKHFSQLFNYKMIIQRDE